MTYLEALRALDEFMVASGIRTYCTEICRGKCCHNNEPLKKRKCCKRISCHEKIPCVGFICWDLRVVLEKHLQKISQVLPRNDLFADLITLNRGGRKTRSSNPYFDSYSLDNVKHIIFPDDCLATPASRVDEIRKVMNTLVASKATLPKAFWLPIIHAK